MIVAPPGFGKTILGASDENVLFLTTDPEGTESAYFMGLKADEWPVQSAKDLYEAYNWLVAGGAEEYNWVVVDNAGEVQKILLAESMRLSRAGKPGLDEFVPSQANYQRSQLSTTAFVKQMHELNVNILWTSHQATWDDSDGETYYAPAIHGQKGDLAQSIAGYMKVVGYGEEVDSEDGEESIRRIWFTHHGPYRGKDRYSVLGAYRDGLTLAKMRSLIDAKRRKVTSPSATRSTTTTKKAPATRRAATRKK